MEYTIAFTIWVLCGLFFYGMGIYAFKSKKSVPMGFWANAKTFPVDNVKAYNRAMGKLWCVFATIFILLGLPLLCGQNSAWVLLSCIGTMLTAIGTMVVYVTVIEPKYRKK